MWTGTNIAITVAVVAGNLIYFVLMSRRWDLPLWVLLLYSLTVTGIWAFLAVRFFHVWAAGGVLIAMLYNIGITIHLLKGARQVSDVLDGH